jgi:CHAT domain-containing protein
MNKLSIFLALVLLLNIQPVLASTVPVKQVSKIEALLREGSNLQRLGYYLDAQTTYQSTLELAAQQGDVTGLALAKSALGYVTYLLHKPEQAEPILQQAIALVKRTTKTNLLALVEYYQGLTAQSLQKPQLAYAYLQQALVNASQTHNLDLTARCHLALASMAQNINEFKQHQQTALLGINQINQPTLAGELRLMLAEQWLDSPILEPLTLQNGSENQRLATIYEQLTKAYAQLPSDQHWAIAQYYGLLGHVYETQQRYTEALRLSQAALEPLQTLHADDLRVFYNWQIARLYTAMQQPEPAITSYRKAITALQAIRQDIPVTYQDGKSSFLQLFGPLYRGAVTLLLQQSAVNRKSPQNPLLTEARELMERLKQTELEDFFKDRCLLTDVQPTVPMHQADKTAVIYPIILADRLEILLGLGDQFYQYTVNVKGDVLDKQVRGYAKQLRKNAKDDPQASQQLYEWLIRPLEAQLKFHAIDTLVFIPDGALRLLPLAALSDGQHYLLERYAIVSTPSLAATQGLPKTAANNTLLVGLSEPGPEVVAQLPEQLLLRLQGEAVQQAGRGIDKAVAVRSVAAKLREFTVPVSLKLTARNLHDIMKSLALPGVKVEIDMLSSALTSQVLFNKNYTLQNFDHAIKQANYSTVHIASHGFFGGSSDESFIMTYDKLLGIDHLETLLKDRGLVQPIDLLVLSACQTAEGDDRAPLGLTGVALKAKAKNALGSLWPINDEAAVKVMQQFYAGFIHNGLTKAKALQQAQLALLRDSGLAHPFYWAAFILVGNGE